MDTMDFAMEIHGKDTEELTSLRIDLFNYLMGLGANPDKIIMLCAIDAELSIRDFKSTN